MYYSRTGVVKRIPNAQKEDNDHDVSKGFVKIEESAICVVRHLSTFCKSHYVFKNIMSSKY